MPLYASNIKVTHGSTVLVKVDDYFTAWPEFSGGFLNSSVDRVGAAGQKQYPRGNVFNSVTLAWMRQYETPDLAFSAALGFYAGIPTTRATLTFLSEGGESKTMADTALPEYSARAEGSNVFYTLTAKGGVIS